MVVRDKRIKYTAVVEDGRRPEASETVDFEPMKRKICNKACLWSSLFTGLLIGAYYIPSIGLTFYQRWFYQTFHFPLLTVIVHMTVKFLLAMLVRLILSRKHKPRVCLGWKEYIVAVGPTGIFSGIDISFSNWGLELITVSLYTMTKSTTIVFILLFAILFKLEKKSWSLCGIVGMITTGLILFTYKATQFNVLGFCLLLLASLSSGLRWTCIQLLLQKSKVGMDNPVDMIYHMQPFMIASTIPIAIWMEGSDIMRSCQLFGFSDADQVRHLTLKILLGAFIAFFMEFTEVTLITYTSSLTLAIAGIFKEVFILGLAVEWNGDVMSPMNVLGLVICLCGISGHVAHKLRTGPVRPPSRLYDADRDRHELNEYLIEDETSEASEGDKSDTQVLFNILSREKRYS